MNIIHIIQEAATWIEKVNNSFDTNLYRTPELSPKHYFCEISEVQKPLVVNQVISKRAELLKSAAVPLIPIQDLENYGKIMFFDAGDTVLDGAAQVESAYFVDIADTPPWDTWIALGGQLIEVNPSYSNIPQKNMLVAWVPAPQYFYANATIEVSCIDNFEWPMFECINPGLQAIRSLFQRPVNIVQPIEVIDYEYRKAKSDIILAELNKNSDEYYNNS